MKDNLSAHPYSQFLSAVMRPARYLGGEVGQINKGDDGVEVSTVLAFPDIYEVGMSHLGLGILYQILNAHPAIRCERVFAPWFDLEKELRARNLPLVSLERAQPLSSFDVVGFSLQYELTFTNVLNMLQLGGIPLRTEERDQDAPLILGGGPCATHPEPVAPFFDAFFIGEAEHLLAPLLLLWKKLRQQGVDRSDALAELARQRGVYVPSLYRVERHNKGRHLVVMPPPADQKDEIPYPIKRVTMDDLADHPFPSAFPVPSVEAVFDRISVEIARGCGQGCRFCEAGFTYRPQRERPPEEVTRAILTGLAHGGYDEASLTSLSTADYSALLPLVTLLSICLSKKGITLSVSSLRAYGLDEQVLETISKGRGSGLTLAPEAGTQRLRDVINKNISEEDLAGAIERAFSLGWQHLKLYFMIGLPTETDADVEAIVDLCCRVLGRAKNAGAASPGGKGRNRKKGRPEIVLSVSSHVPRPHTPFQWEPMTSPEELLRRQHILGQRSRRSPIKLKWHDARVSRMEGILSRGDRSLADTIERAFEKGCRFDGWDEHVRLDFWEEAFGETALDVDHLLGGRELDEALPWDHIDTGVNRKFLLREREKAYAAQPTPPCIPPSRQGKEFSCQACGLGCKKPENTQQSQACQDSLKDRALERVRNTISQLDCASTPTADGSLPCDNSTNSPARQNRFRYRLILSKTGQATMLGHLDLVRHLPRILRRASIPLHLTEGFHPKPAMVFGPALKLGTEGMMEYLDISLQEHMEAGELARKIADAPAPQGLRILGVRQLPQGERSISKEIKVSDWLLWLHPDDLEDLKDPSLLVGPGHPIPKDMEIRGSSGPVVQARLLANIDHLPALAGSPMCQSSTRPLLAIRASAFEPLVRPETALSAFLGRVVSPLGVTRLASWGLTDGGQVYSPLQGHPSADPKGPTMAPCARETDLWSTNIFQ